MEAEVISPSSMNHYFASKPHLVEITEKHVKLKFEFNETAEPLNIGSAGTEVNITVKLYRKEPKILLNEITFTASCNSPPPLPEIPTFKENKDEKLDVFTIKKPTNTSYNAKDIEKLEVNITAGNNYSKNETIQNISTMPASKNYVIGSFLNLNNNPLKDINGTRSCTIKVLDRMGLCSEITIDNVVQASTIVKKEANYSYPTDTDINSLKVKYFDEEHAISSLSTDESNPTEYKIPYTADYNTSIKFEPNCISLNDNKATWKIKPTANSIFNTNATANLKSNVGSTITSEIKVTAADQATEKSYYIKFIREDGYKLDLQIANGKSGGGAVQSKVKYTWRIPGQTNDTTETLSQNKTITISKNSEVTLKAIQDSTNTGSAFLTYNEIFSKWSDNKETKTNKITMNSNKNIIANFLIYDEDELAKMFDITDNPPTPGERGITILKFKEEYNNGTEYTIDMRNNPCLKHVVSVFFNAFVSANNNNTKFNLTLPNEFSNWGTKITGVNLKTISFPKSLKKLGLDNDINELNGPGAMSGQIFLEKITVRGGNDADSTFGTLNNGQFIYHKATGTVLGFAHAHSPGQKVIINSDNIKNLGPELFQQSFLADSPSLAQGLELNCPLEKIGRDCFYYAVDHNDNGSLELKLTVQTPPKCIDKNIVNGYNEPSLDCFKKITVPSGTASAYRDKWKDFLYNNDQSIIQEVP